MAKKGNGSAEKPPVNGEISSTQEVATSVPASSAPRAALRKTRTRRKRKGGARAVTPKRKRTRVQTRRKVAALPRRSVSRARTSRAASAVKLQRRKRPRVQGDSAIFTALLQLANALGFRLELRAVRRRRNARA